MNFQLFGNTKAPTLLLIPVESIHGADIHFWYGTKEAFVAKPQVKHLLQLCPSVHVEVLDGMNHGQMLVDHPDEVAKRIIELI